MHLLNILKQKLRRHRIVIIDEDMPSSDDVESDHESLTDRQFRALSVMRSIGCTSTTDLSLIIEGHSLTGMYRDPGSSYSLAENERRETAARVQTEMLALGCRTITDLTLVICAEPI